MEKRVAIVLGLGEIGVPIYKMLSEAYGVEDVRGWDSAVLPDLGISRAMDEQTFTYMHVCYPQLPGFIESLKEYDDLYKPSHIIIHSTVSPGILEAVQRAVAIEGGRGRKVRVYYSPVRGSHTQVPALRLTEREGMRRGLNSYTKYVGSVSYYPPGSRLETSEAHDLKECITRVMSHLEGAGFPNVKYVGSVEALVWAKLFDLAWYGLNIAFYQELERVVQGHDYEIVENFIASTPRESDGEVRREVFYGGFIGGHCVTQAIEKILADRDIPMLRAVLDSNLKRFVELASEKPSHHPC